MNRLIRVGTGSVVHRRLLRRSRTYYGEVADRITESNRFEADFEDIREGVRKLCSQFPGDGWWVMGDDSDLSVRILSVRILVEWKCDQQFLLGLKRVVTRVCPTGSSVPCFITGWAENVQDRVIRSVASCSLWDAIPSFTVNLVILTRWVLASGRSGTPVPERVRASDDRSRIPLYPYSRGETSWS